MRVFTDKHREKLSKAMTGKIQSAETCRKRSEAQKGRIFSKEHRKKLSEANRHRWGDVENRKNQSKALKAVIRSEEHQKKLAEARLRGRKKDGETLIHEGYTHVYLENHFSGRRYIKEHWLVIEKYFGRLPGGSEQGHHVNENRSDNRVQNLMLFRNVGAHRRFHIKGDDGVKFGDIVFDGRKIK